MSCTHSHTFNIPQVPLADGTKAHMLCMKCLAVKSGSGWHESIVDTDTTGLCSVREWAEMLRRR